MHVYHFIVGLSYEGGKGEPYPQGGCGFVLQ